MALVSKKRHFNLFGKKQYEYRCDNCDSPVEKSLLTYGPDHSHFCPNCENLICSQTSSHTWSEDGEDNFSKKFIDTNDGLEKSIETCGNCYSARVASFANGHVKFLYYKLGSPSQLQSLSTCQPIPIKFNQDGNVADQANCQHNFIELATSKSTKPEDHKKYKKLIKNRNIKIESMYGVDTITYQNSVFGETHYWCYKCGLFRRLNPFREHLLPSKGVSSGDDTDYYNYE